METNFHISILLSVTVEEKTELSKLASQLYSNYSPTTEDWPEKIINHETASFFVARNEKKEIVGMLVLYRYPMLGGFYKAWIEDVVVDAKFRGQRIGEKLVRAALDKAKENNLKSVNLTSRPEREAANHLYQKIGFKKIETNLYRFSFE